jgi:hypothetical protein
MSENSNTPSALPPAGWYPDPHGGEGQRYWDGTQWTAHEVVPESAVSAAAATAAPGAGSTGAGSTDAYAPSAAPASGGAAVLATGGARRFPQLKWWQWTLVAVGVLVLIGIIAGAVGGGRGSSADPDDDRPAVSAPQTDEAEPEPVMVVVPNVVGMDGVTARATLEALGFEVAYDGDDSMPVIAQDVVEGAEAEEGATITLTLEEKPQLTLGQQNAVDSAQSYLDFSGFSRAGLFEQLTSEYGEGYEPADAEFALAYLEQNGLVDWNAEAVESAESYLDFSSFSRQGLYEQLTSEYGEGFTPAQAEHALAAVGY